MPTDFKDSDQAPDISAEEKLEIIARSPVTATPSRILGKIYDEEVTMTLPYVNGGFFMFGGKRVVESIFAHHLDVGDRALYGHGIGTRLIKAACRFSVERDSKVALLEAVWPRLGFVNTALRVFGEDNVRIEHGKYHYGWEADRPLEDLFKDFPPVEGEGYKVGEVIARIDRDEAMSWEDPAYVLPD